MKIWEDERQCYIRAAMEKNSEAENEALKAQLDAVDWSVLEQIERKETVNERGVFAPLEAVETEEIERRRDEFHELGIKALREGKVGAVLLAGGQGTRLGLDRPKGTLNIGIHRELFLFQQLIRNLMDVTDEAGAYVPLYIMTSNINHDDTQAFFEEHSFFGYPKEYVKFFVQEMEPACDHQGRVYMESRTRVAMSPNGNGGWFGSMVNAGLLSDIRSHGIEWINVFAVDNCLQRIADPLFIGATIAYGCESGAKVVRKAAPDEKVGVLCTEDGKPSIAEYYEMTEEMATARKANGDLLYGFGVILNYVFSEKRLEEIWEELITIRNQMGKNLGYANFIPVGYMQQGRTDYGEKEVAAFREQVRTELVPLCEQLYAAQAKRIGVDTLMFYDEKRVFPDGNAVPAGDDDFMVEEARKMYHKISPETGEFIDFMIEHELMDLKNKPGKAATGYMTFLPDYRAPFVFSNFNQTIFDMQVLTHELGHAFAGYMAMREQPITEYYSESTDIAEIHSMSMEQFSYPYAEAFFGKDADKFRFAHLQEAITFVPFGVAVDEFQHICYANPELTPKERTAEWKKLEEKYMPWRKYDADDFFDRGGFWYHKLHIYLYPFYYINYTLTTMGAMEFKKKNYENHETAWQDYLNLCKCGGSMSYLETLRYASGKERASGESVHERMNSGGGVLEIHKTALEESLGFFQGCF